MRRLRFLVAAAAFGCLAAIPASASAQETSQALYGADGAQGNLSNLYEIDRDDGDAARTVGPIGFAVTGLAVHPDTHVLYGTTSNNDPSAPGHLIRVDKETGDGTIIGDTKPATTHGPTDITFTSDGTLYGWTETEDDLVTINLATGDETIVGDSGISSHGNGLAADSDNTLYLTPEGGNGDLYVVNRTTGAATSVESLNGPDDDPIGALSFDDADTLFGARLDFNVNPRTADLITIATSSGDIDSRGPSVDRLDAIEFSEAHRNCPGATANVFGTSGNDELEGTAGPDRIAGNEGDDRLQGASGDDCVFGGAGVDAAAGGLGDDKVRGETGRDRVKGGGGGDRLNGGGGRDKVKGNDGKDRVKGGKGKDKVIGGNGKDKLKGGKGNDKLKAADNRRDVVNCGKGKKDRASFDEKDKVRDNCEILRLIG